MDMQGSRTLAVNQQQAWEALNDPQILQTCVPGCEKFELTEPDTYAITTVVKIGPVSARFSGRLKLSDIVPMQSYKIGFEAQGGAAGFGKGDASVQLTPTDTGCTLTYQVRPNRWLKISFVASTRPCRRAIRAPKPQRLQPLRRPWPLRACRSGSGQRPLWLAQA